MPPTRFMSELYHIEVFPVGLLVDIGHFITFFQMLYYNLQLHCMQIDFSCVNVWICICIYIRYCICTIVLQSVQRKPRAALMSTVSVFVIQFLYFRRCLYLHFYSILYLHNRVQQSVQRKCGVCPNDTAAGPLPQSTPTTTPAPEAMLTMIKMTMIKC